MPRQLPEAAAARVRPVVWTVTAGVLALVLAAAGVAKLTGDDTFTPVFDALGFPDAVAGGVGLVELVLTAGVLWPRTRTWAAAGIVVLMVLALGAGLLAGESRFLVTNLMLGAAAGMIVRHATAPSPTPPPDRRSASPTDPPTSPVEEVPR
ncbi:MAG: DoxX family protein [Acidimicrobiales bacterium]